MAIPVAFERILQCLHNDQTSDEPFSWTLSRSYGGEVCLKIWTKKVSGGHGKSYPPSRGKPGFKSAGTVNLGTNNNNVPDSAVKKKKSPSRIKREKQRSKLKRQQRRAAKHARNNNNLPSSDSTTDSLKPITPDLSNDVSQEVLDNDIIRKDISPEETGDNNTIDSTTGPVIPEIDSLD